MMPRVLGLDIGGANLKAATADGQFSQHLHFAMWAHPEQLAKALSQIIDSTDYDYIAVTMTGELADCFTGKQQGVQYISEQVVKAAGTKEPLFFYQTDGNWSTADCCNDRWASLAASNWHALATFAASTAPAGQQLLIDIGSTTTDIIPLSDGKPLHKLLSDVDRLSLGQLVYCGIQRTPICSLLDEFQLEGRAIPLAREFFSTTLDAFLLTTDIDEDPSNLDTADGRPATQYCARTRLARTFCECPSQLSLVQAQQLANLVKSEVLQLIDLAISQVVHSMPEPPTEIISSGDGQFLLSSLQNRLPIRELLASGLSRVAPAYAVAQLLDQHLSKTVV